MKARPAGRNTGSGGKDARFLTLRRTGRLLSMNTGDDEMNIDQLCEHFSLSYDTIRKIIKTTQVEDI